MSFWRKLATYGLVRKFVYMLVGGFSYPGIAIVNKLEIRGTEHIENLPKRNVLFVSNHQTYFADVITFLHIFCAVKWRKRNKLGVPYYLLNPFTRVYYVAAEETMKSSWISRLFTLAGALTVKRTWKKDGAETRRGLDPSDTRKIERHHQTFCAWPKRHGIDHQTLQADGCSGRHQRILAGFRQERAQV
jgi:1-acyl-sn-glycerol-3-phosphate acyltransferase